MQTKRGTFAVALATLLVGTALAGVLLSWGASAQADSQAGSPAAEGSDRQQAMRDALADGGVYLEDVLAHGDPDLWRQRLRDAAAEADIGVPVRVAFWTEIAGQWPDRDQWVEQEPDEQMANLGLSPNTVLLTNPYSNSVDHGALSVKTPDRVRAWLSRSEAVVDRLQSQNPDPDRYPGLSAVAKAWVMLRLASPDQQPQQLVEELAQDASLFDDGAWAPDEGEGSEYTLSPWTIVVAGIFLAAVIALFLRIVAVERRTERAAEREERRGLTADTLLDTLTPLALEREVTGLAEQIAASEVAPGDPAYDEAQACLDAAGKYVDSELDRDRVGVHLLVADGAAALEGRTPSPRCFINPTHTATTSVHRRETTLPCCASCAGLISRRQRPQALLVADADGEVAAYYETEDVWTATGYGSIDERWARRALLAALETR